MPQPPVKPRPTPPRRRILMICAYLAAVLIVAVIVVVSRDDGTDAKGKNAAAAAEAPDPKASTTLPVIETVKQKGSVLEALGEVEGASRFASVVESLPKQPFLQERGVTLLVPLDDALSKKDADKLRKDANAASTFVARHMVVGRLTLKGLAPTVTTSDGTKRKVDVKKATIDGVDVTEADLEATNGYLQLLSGSLK